MNEPIAFGLPCDIACRNCSTQLKYRQKMRAKKYVEDGRLLISFKCPQCKITLSFAKTGENAYLPFRGCEIVVPADEPAIDGCDPSNPHESGEPGCLSNPDSSVFSVPDIDVSALLQTQETK